MRKANGQADQGKMGRSTRRVRTIACWVGLVAVGLGGMVQAQNPGFPQVPVGVPQIVPSVQPQPAPAPGIAPAAFQGEKQPNPLPEKVKGIEMGPEPKPFEPFGPFRPRLPRLPGVPGPLGSTPEPSKKVLEEYGKYVVEFIDPRNTLDMIEGRARLMILSETPKRIQVADEAVATYNVLGPKEITLLGKKVGTTVMNFWFVDAANKEKEKVLSYLVRVFPDSETKERLERIYKALEDDINRTFPDSVIHVKLVGDKLLVTGQARDIVDATQILRVLRANAPPEQQAKIPVTNVNVTYRPGDPGSKDGIPGLDSFLAAGGPNVINLIRIPGEQQVMLKVTVAEVNRSAARSIGMNFNLINNKGLQFLANTTGSLGAGLGAIASGGNLPVSLDNGQINLAISALKNLNYARSLAEPNLVALNGQTAFFQAGGQFPVPVVTGATATGLQGVQFVPYGVQLNFTPFITDKDRVRLQVNATVSTRDISANTNIGGANVPGLNTRTFATTVELREGQTMAVAGLIQNNLGAETARIPFLGEIPLLNRVTGLDKTTSGEQELVILITPQLIHPMEPKEVPPLPGSDLFEPSDLEFYLLGRIESRRAYDYRSTVMTDCARMRRYHQCERLYIFGPTGHDDAVPTLP